MFIADAALDELPFVGEVRAALEGDATGVLMAALIPGGRKAKKVYDEGIEFTADLSKSRARSRSGHRNAGNKQLNEAMEKNPELREKMKDKLGEDVVERTSTSGKGRRNPRGYEWDHNTYDKNKLDLRSKENHATKTANDPGRRGGYFKFYTRNKNKK